KYGFINKKGEIVFSDSGASYTSLYTGYSQSKINNHIMDLEGKIVSQKEFLKSFGVQEDIYNETILFPDRDKNYSYVYGEGVVPFWVRVDKSGPGMKGLLFLEKGTALFGPFSASINKYDSISGLT